MKINFLDHVAIRVNDMEKSAKWYEDNLGLSRFEDSDNWGPFPFMMISGTSGIALFPKKEHDDLDYVSARMHIAFNVDNESFEQFQISLKNKGIDYSFEDHHWFHSIYMKDLDGYTIELTTRIMDTIL